jgi:hypothetical protein
MIIGGPWLKENTKNILVLSKAQIKISRFMFLKKRKSRDFFTHTNKNLEKKNLEIFGGHLAIFFCEVNLEIFVS